MKVFAMIPARSGSKGLPDKNISPAGGVPLIGHAVNFAKKLDIDRIVVSTDSKAYVDLAVEYEPMIWWHQRGEQASSDTAMEEDIIADYVASNGEMPDIWVWIKPTSPFRSVASVEEAICVLAARPYVDSVRIVSEADPRLQVAGEMGWLEPLLPLLWPGGRSKARRTEFPKVYKPFNLEVFRHSGWTGGQSYFMGHRIHPIIEDKITGLDVDDARDLEIIDLIVNADPRPDWLKSYIHDGAPHIRA